MRALVSLVAALAVITSVAAARAVDAAAVQRIKAASAAERKDGFKIREDFWTGVAKVGSRNSLKHQLFRGNEYWFWLAAAQVGPPPSLKVYDAKGRPVDVETKADKGWVAARILPPRTGTYTVVFLFESPKDSRKEAGESVTWAMTYGYR